MSSVLGRFLGIFHEFGLFGQGVNLGLVFGLGNLDCPKYFYKVSNA